MCGCYYNLEEHHIFFGIKNRQMSEKYGLKVHLCQYHHRDSKEGVHFKHEFDLELKRKAQKIFEEKHSREEFINIFGKNYL